MNYFVALLFILATTVIVSAHAENDTKTRDIYLLGGSGSFISPGMTDYSASHYTIDAGRWHVWYGAFGPHQRNANQWESVVHGITVTNRCYSGSGNAGSANVYCNHY